MPPMRAAAGVGVALVLGACLLAAGPRSLAAARALRADNLLALGRVPWEPASAVPAAAVRVRREIRSLSPGERRDFFQALWVMKRTDTAAGVRKYGAQYVAYDDLTRKHMRAASDPRGDTAHLGPGFATYHRAFTLLFENALLAVARGEGLRVTALPYWDYNVEAGMADPRASVIWSDEYFGPSAGNAAKGSVVDTGPFAEWTIPRKEGREGNAHGLLRSPWNLNPGRGLTRHATSCGGATTFGAEAWDRCAAAPTYLLWYACVEPGLHTWGHSFLGGIWHNRFNTSRIPCFMANAVAVPELYTQKCLECPDTCADESCACAAAPSVLCAAARPLLPTAWYGDFADAWTSPNDPIFFPHHANVDRALMRWQRRHDKDAETYGFPAQRGPLAPGHGLDDVIAPADPFTAALFGGGDRLLTNADVLRGTEPGRCPYTYDVLE